MLTEKVCEPIGNAMEDWKIWAELGKRMGYGAYFPWADNNALVDELLGPTGISRSELRRIRRGCLMHPGSSGSISRRGSTPRPERWRSTQKHWEKMGYDPLPTFEEPLQSRLSRPELAKLYPLTMISYRTNPYTGSQYFNLQSAKKRAPEPWVDIHPQTAEACRISEGDWVKVESLQGAIKLKARVTADILPDVIAVPFGWGGEAGSNRLTDDRNCDPLSAFPSFKPMCRVKKMEA